MSDIKKKVDESWKDKVESEKADAKREEHKQEQKPPEADTGRPEGAAGQEEGAAGQEESAARQEESAARQEESAAGQEESAAGQEESAARQEPQSSDAQSADAPTEFPPIQAGFITLVADLAMQASLFMGEIPDPETNEPMVDLNRAKYLIDILGMLEEKTKGNLSPEEQGSLKNVLYELRMTFVAKTPKP